MKTLWTALFTILSQLFLASGFIAIAQGNYSKIRLGSLSEFLVVYIFLIYIRTEICVALWRVIEWNNRPHSTIFINTIIGHINNQTLCNSRTTRTLPWKPFNRFKLTQTKNWIISSLNTRTFEKLFFKKLSVTANIPSSLYNENLALLFAKCNEPDNRGSWSMIFI